MISDMFADKRQNFFENFAAILHELHVAAIVHVIMGAAQKAVVVTDIV